MDLRAGAVTLPTATAPPHPDLVRALAVDIVVQDLLDNGADGACVAIGNHIRVAGAAPTSAGWQVPGPAGRIRLHDGAMVTVELPDGAGRRVVTAAMPTAWAATVAAQETPSSRPDDHPAQPTAAPNHLGSWPSRSC